MDNKQITQDFDENGSELDWSAIPLASQTLDADALSAIMNRLDHLLATLGSATTNANSPKSKPAVEDGAGPVRRARPALPDPRLVRNLLKARQLRMRYLGADLFADPAWDMLLDLTASRAEHRRVSVTSLCIASGVPTTTALRWMKLLEQAGLIQRVEDDTDRRRAFVMLSDQGAVAMARFFEVVVKQFGTLID